MKEVELITGLYKLPYFDWVHTIREIDQALVSIEATAHAVKDAL